MRILDNAGVEVTLDELNARAIAWHREHAPIVYPPEYWEQFYRDRAEFDLTERRDPRRRRRIHA